VLNVPVVPIAGIEVLVLALTTVKHVVPSGALVFEQPVA